MRIDGKRGLPIRASSKIPLYLSARISLCLGTTTKRDSHSRFGPRTCACRTTLSSIVKPKVPQLRDIPRTVSLSGLFEINETRVGLQEAG